MSAAPPPPGKKAKKKAPPPFTAKDTKTPDTETMTAAPTPEPPPPPPSIPRVPLLERMRALLRGFAERMKRETEQEDAPDPAGLSLKMPGRRAILALLIPLALLLLALHAISAMALGDLADAAARPKALASDLLVQGLRPVVARGDERIVSVLSPDGRTASVRSAGEPAQLALPSAAILVADEPDGRVVVTRLGPRTAIERALDSIGAHWRETVWRPVAGFARARILPLMLQVDPLLDPASAKPRRLGVYRPCRDCPEMAEFGPGVDLLGPMLWQRSGSSVGVERRTAVMTAGFRISGAPVTLAQWKTCGCPQGGRVEEGAILFDHPSDAAPYLAWLASRTGRRFRIPTSQEWELAVRASARAAGRPPLTGGMGEWVCLPTVRDKVRTCAYARRGATGAFDELLPESATGALLRLVEDVHPATASPVTAPQALDQVAQAIEADRPVERGPLQQKSAQQRPVRRTPAQQPPVQQAPPEQNLAY